MSGVEEAYGDVRKEFNQVPIVQNYSCDFALCIILAAQNDKNAW